MLTQDNRETTEAKMTELVVSETLYALIAGRMLLATLTLAVGGYFIGFNARGVGAKVGWTLVLLVAAAAMIFTSAHMRDLQLGAQTGVFPRGFFDAFIVTLFGSLLALMLAGLWVGTAAASRSDALDVEAAVSMTAADFVAEIDVLAAHPSLSQSGWISNRWYKMSAEERLDWAGTNLSRLRNLRVENSDSDLGGHGIDLPMRLAQIDAAT